MYRRYGVFAWSAAVRVSGRNARRRKRRVPKEKGPGRVAWDLDRLPPIRPADASGDRVGLVARPPHGTVDAPRSAMPGPSKSLTRGEPDDGPKYSSGDPPEGGPATCVDPGRTSEHERWYEYPLLRTESCR